MVIFKFGKFNLSSNKGVSVSPGVKVKKVFSVFKL